MWAIAVARLEGISVKNGEFWLVDSFWDKTSQAGKLDAARPAT